MPAPQFARQTETRDKAGCFRTGRGYGQTRWQCCRGIEDDRCEEDFEPAFLVAEDAPDDAADEQAQHLDTENIAALAIDIGGAETEAFE